MVRLNTENKHEMFAQLFFDVYKNNAPFFKVALNVINPGEMGGTIT